MCLIPKQVIFSLCCHLVKKYACSNHRFHNFVKTSETYSCTWRIGLSPKCLDGTGRSRNCDTKDDMRRQEFPALAVSVMVKMVVAGRVFGGVMVGRGLPRWR